jgi:WD40 repeat protein
MEQIKKMKGHAGDVYALELMPDDGFSRHGGLASGGDYSIKTWNLAVFNIFIESGSNLLNMIGHSGYVSCIKVHGKRLFSGSWDTTIRSWNLDVSVCLKRLEKPCMFLKGTKI